MAKRVICFALGGHIPTQNASFRKLVEILQPEGYEFFGAEDGFRAFETGVVYELRLDTIPKYFAGFVAGASRDSLRKKDGAIDEKKLEKAVDFFRKGKFEIGIGSGGDDHGKELALLKNTLEGRVQVYALNKTMDNDLGGEDGKRDSDNIEAPYTDFTNGFHTAVNVGAEEITKHLSGAWTNNLPYLIGVFGRETNWVSIALTYFGLADKIIYGELPEEHPGHSVEKIYETILQSQNRNERTYGRRFAMVVVAEGTRISGIEHVSKELIDPHGHHKLQPEILVSHLKTEMERRYKLKTQTLGITYEMRNFPPTEKDIQFAEMSAEVLAQAIRQGKNGAESVFKIIGNEIIPGVAPIEKVSEKRYSYYYEKHMAPLVDRKSFEVTNEIGKYYRALFGERKSLSSLLPKKPKIVCVV